MSANLIVTISRQMGSGGSEIAYRLAKRLGVRYIDREILTKTARILEEKEQVIADRSERVSGLWEETLRCFCLGSAETSYIPPPLNFIPDSKLFAVKSMVIKEIAKNCSAVIVGHGGFHILREHPRIVNIFVHADPSFRARRAMAQYSVSTFEEAMAMIQDSDRERQKLVKKVTSKEWSDALNFDLSLDSGKGGQDLAFDVALRFIQGADGCLPAKDGCNTFD
ncbi:MAG: cytidylate kinase-like family protein [Geobacteraceae bacterium]|nr:cytidylate kinase-like family protein [Geobacteraceae bacterium]